MSEDIRFEELDEDGRRLPKEGSMRRRSIANSRTRSRKRASTSASSGPTKFNGIHRRRSKRTSW